MFSFSKRSTLAVALAWGTLFGEGVVSRADGGVDELARKMAPLLKPASRSVKGTKADMAAPRTTTIAVIEKLQSSTITNGPDGVSLIETAYRFRPDVAPMESLLTSSRLLKNWRQAQALGLFNKKHVFSTTITLGPEKGKKVRFEYIVPPELMPQMSNHPANVRIVAPSEARRGEVEELNARDKAYREQFVTMITEDVARDRRLKVEKGTKFGPAGLTAEQEHERWLAAMRRAGDEAKVTPSITLRAHKAADPVHGNKNRWRVDAEVHNRSRHPTEVQIVYWLVGVTKAKNRHYMMVKKTLDVELLGGQVKPLTLWTHAKSSYEARAMRLDGVKVRSKSRSQKGKKGGKASQVSYRGFLIQAVHGGERIATHAPDLGLEQYFVKDSGKHVSQLK